MKALTFGIEISSKGYHLFATGPTGTGKTTIIRKQLERDARSVRCPTTGCT